MTLQEKCDQLVANKKCTLPLLRKEFHLLLINILGIQYLRYHFYLKGILNLIVNMIKDYITNDDEIIFALNKLIPEIHICNYILNIKKSIERKTTLDYHNYLYHTIAKSFYEIRQNHMNRFSIIFTKTNYIVKADYNINYYIYTGMSYQIKELINDLIVNINDTILIKENDELYTLLSQKITERMNYKLKKEVINQFNKKLTKDVLNSFNIN